MQHGLVLYRHMLCLLIDCHSSMSRFLIDCSARRGRDDLLRGSVFERLQVIILERQFQEVQLDWLWCVIITRALLTRVRLWLDLQGFVGINVPARMIITALLPCTHALV